MHLMMALIPKIWAVLPDVVVGVVGIIGLLASLLQNQFLNWETDHPNKVRIIGGLLSLGLICAGVSDYQQRSRQVTKADISKLPNSDYVDARFMKLETDLGKKMDRLPKEKPPITARNLPLNINGVFSDGKTALMPGKGPNGKNTINIRVDNRTGRTLTHLTFFFHLFRCEPTLLPGSNWKNTTDPWGNIQRDSISTDIYYNKAVDPDQVLPFDSIQFSCAPSISVTDWELDITGNDMRQVSIPVRIKNIP